MQKTHIPKLARLAPGPALGGKKIAGFEIISMTRSVSILEISS